MVAESRAADRGTSPASAWARAGSVRVRTTVAAVVIVGVALLVGAVALVILMRATLTDHVIAGARLRADEAAMELAAGDLDDAIPPGASEDLVMQVVDGNGRVMGATANVEGRPPIADLSPGGWTEIMFGDEAEPFAVVAVGTDSPRGPLTVLAARPLEDVIAATDLVTGLLGAGLPAMLLVVAITAWIIIGRALAPVEAIRSEVDAISAAELHRRVPQPSATDEIARLAATMNRMLDRLERAQARQRQFVSDTSHELRSPIASIRQHAEVAIAHPERVLPADLAQSVLADDLRLQSLVDDLLLLARADEHTLGLDRKPVDLDDLVFEEAARLRSTTKLAIDTSKVSAGRVEGDPTGLRRVLGNLADNAARHARSRVAFSLAERDTTVELTIDDDGPGIPPADRQRVFDRFVRLDAARDRDAGGSGLGMAIVAELVAAHGGSVAIEDAPLGGARVAIRLRRSED